MQINKKNVLGASIDSHNNATTIYRTELIKTSLLINSGALIATLAFMSNLITTGVHSPLTLDILCNSLLCFVFGITFSGVSFFFLEKASSYEYSIHLNTMIYNDIIETMDLPYDKIELLESSHDSRYKIFSRFIDLCIWLNKIIVTLSYLSFLVGSYIVYISIKSYI